MPRGGLVNNAGTCIGVVMAASDRNDTYIYAADGTWISFIPDTYCNVGDHWSGSVWLYASTTPPTVNASQATIAITAAGFLSQLNTALAGVTTANRNIWQPPGITAADAVITALAAAVPLTAAQVRSILTSATAY